MSWLVKWTRRTMEKKWNKKKQQNEFFCSLCVCSRFGHIHWQVASCCALCEFNLNSSRTKFAAGKASSLACACLRRASHTDNTPTTRATSVQDPVRFAASICVGGRSVQVCGSLLSCCCCCSSSCYFFGQVKRTKLNYQVRRELSIERSRASENKRGQMIARTTTTMAAGTWNTVNERDE